MKLIRDLTKLPEELRGGAVAIGNFDGVHRGHAKIVSQLLSRAREVDGPAVVFTFDPHPVRLLRPKETPPPLTWTDRKVELLVELGVDTMIAYPTDEALLQLSPEDFFNSIVRDQLAAKAIIEGPNFFFGHDRLGDIDVLRSLADQADISVDVVEPLRIGGTLVSSSRVRKLIAAGLIDQAQELMTRPYRIRGMVTHGAGRGHEIGFPTANLEAIDTLLPGEGVYAGRGIAGSKAWPAAINIGPNPTFGESRLKIEAHLIGCDESLYGCPLEIDFFSRIRDTLTFDGIESLKSQLNRDIEMTKDVAHRFW